MSPDAALLLTIATVALSSFVQSVTGFGFGLVAMALLPLFINFKDAYVILAIPNIALCALNFLANYRYYRWRQGLWLVIGACVAVPFGFYLMVHMNQVWLTRALGVLILIFSGSELLFSKTRPLRLPENWGMPMGFFSGSLSGAFSIGGPPAVAYVYSRDWDKRHTVALLQLVFGTSSVVRLGLLQGAGMMTPRLLFVSGACVGPLIVAIILGQRVLRKMKSEHIRLMVLVLLLLISVKYLAE